MKTKKKNLKPIETDAHFKYKCPQNTCGYDHWLSLKQVSTKNFKVVCECGGVFKPKNIHKIKIIYEEETKKQSGQIISDSKKTIVREIFVPLDLQASVAKILVGYGFTNNECEELIKKAYVKNPVDDIGSLVKYIIKNLGELNEFN